VQVPALWAAAVEQPLSIFAPWLVSCRTSEKHRYQQGKTVANYHLVIMKKPYLDAILAGRKRVESRFAKTKRVYIGRVLAGDKLFLKESSGPVRAVATAAAVKDFEKLTPKKISSLKQQYNHLIIGSDEYWQSKVNCRFGLLVWMKTIKRIEPMRIRKKDRRAWVVLTEKENFDLPRAGRSKTIQ
jgi:ASC-1-like (ASCH) protein